MLVYSNELCHHGILGQKWGIRRFQNKDGSLTKAGAARYGVGTHGEFLGQSRDEDIRIKAGAMAQRVSSNDKENESGRTYVSFDKLDHLNYVDSLASGTIGDGVTISGKSKNGYSIELKVTNDIIAPSYQKTMDTFKSTIDDIGIKEVAKTVESHSYNKSKQFIKDIKAFNIEECRDRAYKAFCTSMFSDSAARKDFFSKLQKQGYNAIVDDEDVNFGNGFTKSALIVFEKQNNLKQTNVKEITDKDLQYASDMAVNPMFAKDATTEKGKQFLKEMEKRWGI